MWHLIEGGVYSFRKLYVDINPLTTNDDYGHHQTSATGYQYGTILFEDRSALAERVGRGEVGRCHLEGDSPWLLL